MKRFFTILRAAFVWIIVAIAAVMLIFTLFCTQTSPAAGRSVFGYQGLIVLSDSMRATGIDAGDVILIKEVEPSTLKAGDIITYISQDPDSFGETITHMIRDLTTVNGHPGFITYGTTTDTNDRYVVTYPDIIGKHQLTVPKVGAFFQHLKSPKGYITFILLPFGILLALQIVNLASMLRRIKASQMAEIEEERKKIEDERAENQKLVDELRELKAQLTGAPPQDPNSPSAETPPATQTV